MDDYDALFYQGIAIPETHPESLAVRARLMGVAAAHPARCRVLELGCATGANLIPMAESLPGASLLGVDLSPAQVAEGKRLIERLGLSNLRLRQGDILTLDPDSDPQLGQFDYVIAHGVYSWVPAQVQARLLRLARQVLAPNGVFYVSYNTLPGWRMRGMLRDILLDACAGLSTPAERLAQAERALGRLGRALTGLPGEAARYLREELRRLGESPPSYLYFEFLAGHNSPVLFRDFARAAEEAGLRYLCDSDLQTLFPSSLGEQVEQALADIEDGLDLEQWLDFIANRNFRQSLLIRSDLEADETLSLERFAAFSLSADLKAPVRDRLKDSGVVAYERPGGQVIEVSHPLTKAVLLALTQVYPDALPLPDLVPQARQAVQRAGAGARADDLDHLLAELFGLFARGAIRAHLEPRRVPTADLERPRARELVRLLAQTGQPQVPTRDHGNLDLDPWAARLIGLLDGRTGVGELADRLGAGHEASAPSQPPGKRRRADGAGSGSTHEYRVQALVRIFARYGLLAEAGDRVKR